jgi:hypothetical protein
MIPAFFGVRVKGIKSNHRIAVLVGRSRAHIEEVASRKEQAQPGVAARRWPKETLNKGDGAPSELSK